MLQTDGVSVNDRIKIEHGIPLPPARNKCRYPYKQMAINDSFFVPDAGQNEIANQAHRWSKKLGRTFVTRKRAGGVRVWRIA